MAEIKFYKKGTLNQSEEKVLEWLAGHLPPEYTIYPSITIFVPDHQSSLNKPRECEMICVAPHAIYTIEVKDAGGKILIEPDGWRVDGTEFRFFGKNPMVQADSFAKKLASALSGFNSQLSDIYVQSMVCFAHEGDIELYKVDVEGNRVRVDDDTEPNEFSHCIHYRKAHEYIQNVDLLSNRTEWESDQPPDIVIYGKLVEMAVKEQFFHPRKIGKYKITSGAWFTDRYRAYYATHPTDSRKVILKVYYPPRDLTGYALTAFHAELEREANALSAISSGSPEPGKTAAPAYIDSFIEQSNNARVIVIEDVEGILLQYLIQSRMLSLRLKYLIGGQLCQGIAYIHSQNIVHRNLHPGNIIYQKWVPNLIRIINFDYAKFTDKSQPTFMLNNVVDPRIITEWTVSRRYQPPEFSMNNTLVDLSASSPESDKYSLGIILWELFTGCIHDYSQPVQIEKLTTVKNLDTKVIQTITDLCSNTLKVREQVSLIAAARLFEVLARQPHDPEDRSLPEFAVQQRWNSYSITRMIAKSLFSSTYEAKKIRTDIRVDEKVVIKFLIAPEKSAGEEIERVRILLQDPQVAAHSASLKGSGFIWMSQGEIVNKNTSHAYRVGYQVFEFLEGESLKDLVDKGGCDGEKSLQILRGILAAVKPLHDLGYIHQDIKPDNLILAKDGTVKIIDFGLTRQSNSRARAIGITLGYAPSYVLPRSGGKAGRPWTIPAEIHSIVKVGLAILCGEDRARGGPLLDWNQIEAKVGPNVAHLLGKQIRETPEGAPPDACQSIQELIDALDLAIEKNQTEEKQMNPVDQVQSIINNLNQRKLAELQIDNFDDAMRIGEHIEALENWMKSGLAGNCPVDLSEYGFDLIIENNVENPPDEQTDGTEEQEPIEELPENTTQVALSAELTEAVSLAPEQKEGIQSDTVEQDTSELTESVQTNEVTESSLEKTQPPDKIARQLPVDEVERRRQMQQEIQGHIRMAQEYLEESDFSLADAQLKSLEALDPTNSEAHNLRMELRKRRKAKELAELIEALKTKSDIEELDLLIKQATDLLVTEYNPALSEAKDNAYQRYEAKRSDQGARTTTDQMADYEKVIETTAVLERDIADGQKKWYFRGNFLDVENVSVILKQQQVDNATGLAIKQLEKAKSYVLGATHSPRTALSELSKAFRYTEMTSETLQELNRYQLQWQKEAEAYDAAEVVLQKAAVEKNPLTRLQYLRQATILYSYHPNLAELRPQYLSAGVDAFYEVCKEAAEEADRHLKGEDTEAVNNVLHGAADGKLAVFGKARQELKNARDQAAILTEVQEDLDQPKREKIAQALGLLDQMDKQIADREARRQNIHILYMRIAAELKPQGNAELAKDLYLKAVDYKNDKVIELLADKITSKLNDSERLAEAENWLITGEWQKALDQCRQVKDPKLNQMRKRLEGLADLNLKSSRILDLWARGYYEDASQPIQQVKDYSSNIPDITNLRDSIITRLELDAKLTRLQEMRQISDANRVLPEMEQLKRDLPELLDGKREIDVLGKNDRRLEQVIKIYQRILGLESLGSSYQGQLHDWKRRVEAALLNQLLTQLEAIKNQPANRERAYRFAEILWKNQLTEDTAQTELCRAAILAYFEEQNQPLKDRQEWEKLLRNWESAVKSFGNELPSVKQTLKNLRHEYLLLTLDRSLQELNQDRVAQILNQELKPCVFDFSLPYVYDVEADPELQIRQAILKIMQDTDTLLRAGNFEQSVVYLHEKRDALPEQVRSAYASALVKKENYLKQVSVQRLQSIATDGGQALTTRTYAFARILGFDPEHVEAKNWLSQNAGQVRFELDQKISQGNTISVEADLVETQLATDLELLSSLKAFQSVCDTLEWRSKAEVDQAVKQVERVITALREANKILIDYAPTGPAWLSALKTGAWSRVDEEIDDLKRILDLDGETHAQVIKLEQRVLQAKRDRQLMIQYKNNLESSFQADKIDQALESCAEIEVILFKYTGRHLADIARLSDQEEPDPFRVFLRNFELFDPFLKDFVPFFAPYQSASIARTIPSLLQERQENLHLWTDYLEDLQNQIKTIGEYPAVRAPYTLRMKEDLELYLYRFLDERQDRLQHELEEIAKADESTVEEMQVDIPWLANLPQTSNGKTTQGLEKEVNLTIAKLKAQLCNARKDWVRLARREQDIIAATDELSMNFRQGPETMARIRELIDFYANSSQGKIQVYLAHLRQMAIE